MAQINPTMGDLDGNRVKIEAAIAQAADNGADLVVCPEMVVLGYPPEDLVLKSALQDHARDVIERLAAATADGPAVVLGAPWREGAALYNAALLLQQGRIAGMRAKHELPNYGVFDDKRVFAAGPIPGPMALELHDGRRVRLGVMVCEDMWIEDVAEGLAESAAELLVVINASPFEVDKGERRMQHAVARVTETGLPLLYVNQVGGQDELVFDGGSFVLDAGRRLRVQAPQFDLGVYMTEWHEADGGWTCAQGLMHAPDEPLAVIYRALMLGLRDYVAKNGFPGVVLGLSGGIDSALSAAIAADALGPDKVHAVMMPSRYTSQESLDDAAGCAAMLGIKLDEVPIAPAVDGFHAMLAPLFGNRAPDITEENIQSRVRGVTLMAMSNKLGPMLLTTGNKSEMSVGYATLYGDMCGGYSVLKDVYKTDVFRLSVWRNGHTPADALGPDGPVMPARVISKPPSAELRPDQKDEDSLPPYERLDAILRGLIEDDRSAWQLIEAGHDEAEVTRVSNLLDIAEYKRRQAPPGVKITEKAFGRDRRYPITNHFRRIAHRRHDGSSQSAALHVAPDEP